MAQSNTTAEIEARMEALPDGLEAFSHTQAAWRFLNNSKVTPQRLSEPLVANRHGALAETEGDYALSMHDWSRINYGSHKSNSEDGEGMRKRPANA